MAKKQTTPKKHTTDIKEQYACVLDFLPMGHEKDTRPIHLRKPLAQAVGVDYFILLELSTKEGVQVNVGEMIFVGKGERDKVKHVEKHIEYDELTPSAKIELTYRIMKTVKENEAHYVNFYNNLPPISDLLPGKSKWMILKIYDERKKNGKFTSYKNIQARVKGLGSPDKLIVKRIENEIMGNTRKILTA
jgi:putative nucleotide binding protein